MKLVRSIALVAIACAAAPLAVACGGSVENPQTSASAMTKAPVGAGTHGMVKAIGDALGEVPLRAEQRSELEKLAQEAEARHAPMAAGRRELIEAVADQIEKGTIDRAALQPKIDRTVADLDKTRGDDRAALNRLHALLDADQRNAFVDALERQMKSKHEHRGKGMHGFAKLKQLADDLKLTDEQRSQIKDALRGMRDSEREGHHGGWHHGKHREGGKHALESFREESWNLDKAAPPADLQAKASEGTTRMLGVAEKILPVLTPEQRKIAADKLRALGASGGELPFAN